MSEKNISEFIDGELYEAENPWGADEEFYMDLARRQGGPVLDLACGTGRLLLTIAREGIEGFGLDLAEPMLKLAEARKGKLPVAFQKADMRFFDLPRRFQLCVMSGHAFQMLLTKEDQRLCLARLAKTLLPGARLSFETRNLAVTDIGPPGQWQFWRAFQAPDGRWIDVETKSVMEEGGRVEYCQSRRTYRDGSGVMPSDIRLRYTPVEEVDALLAEAGFAVEERYGFWDKRPFDPKTSPEILTVARLRA